jgi:hypothetical protein
MTTVESGKLPEGYVAEPAPAFEQIRVADLRPHHGDAYLGVGDVAVDTDRACWVLLDAPVFGADFQAVAPVIIRRKPDDNLEVRMGGLSDSSGFTLIATPDASKWVKAEVLS